MENTGRIENIIAQTAMSFGVSERELVLDIEAAVCDAIITAYRNNDKKTLEMWERIPRSGSYPSAHEIIAYLGNEVKQWREKA